MSFALSHPYLFAFIICYCVTIIISGYVDVQKFSDDNTSNHDFFEDE